MRVEYKCSKHVVNLGICLILDNGKDIETREDRVSELNVVIEVAVNAIDSTNRVSSGNDGTAGLKLSNNTSFRDGDSLLFHSLVDTSSVLLVHLIELVNKADTFISKNECSSFKRPFSCDGVFVDSSSETDSTSSFTSGVNNTMVELLCVLKELRFSSTWISQE